MCSGYFQRYISFKIISLNMCKKSLSLKSEASIQNKYISKKVMLLFSKYIVFFCLKNSMAGS